MSSQSAILRTVQLWILNHYAATIEKDGGEARHALLAKNLVDSGWVTTLVAASVSHPSGIQKLNGWKVVRREAAGGYEAYWLRVPGYKGNGFRRALGMLIFGFLCIIPGILSQAKRPDVVMGSAVHHFAALAAWVLARRHKVPFVFEVRDVWPDVLIDFGKLSETGLTTWILRKVSKFLCSQAALVVSPLPNLGLWVQEMGLPSKPVLWVSNGTDPEYLLDVQPLPPREPFVFLYLGSFGNINALERLIDVFSRFRTEFPELDCRLRLVGAGWKKQKIQELIFACGLQGSVSLEQAVPKDSAMLETQSAHCLVLPIRDAKSHQKYGISPNKLFDYLLAARPILFLGDDPIDLVTSSRAGYSARLSKPKMAVEAMRKLVLASDEELEEFGRNARELVLKEYAFASLSKKLAQALDNLKSGS